MPPYPFEPVLTNLGKLAIRLLVGLWLAFRHGWPTVVNLFAGETDYPDPLGIGSVPTMALMSFAEFLCALLVGIGLFTRLAAIPLVIGFGVAVFVHHAGEPLSQIELAYMYWSFSVSVLLLGGGTYSLDYWLFTGNRTLRGGNR
jgi:putative oxidoreductase